MSDVATRDSFPGMVGVVLAAGEGRRLEPLSALRPKPLCPVGNRPMIDLAIERTLALVGQVAVNLHHDADAIGAHLERAWGDTITVGLEQSEALGTAGAIARLRPWIDGRGVVIVNSDAWCDRPITDLLRGWGGGSVRVMAHATDTFGPSVGVVASVLPWSVVHDLVEQPSGLYESVWRQANERGALEVVRFDGRFVDCGTPSAYLEANLCAVALAGGSIIDPSASVDPSARVERSVIGAGAVVRGEVVDSVVWSGQSVGSGETLLRSIRAGTSVTVGPV
jgi:MurNAc alpha-1-phosphate uridylyltransferase